MMKKLLVLSFSLFMLVGMASAQCTPDPSKTSPGYYPDSATGIPPAYATVAYSTIVQVRTPKDTVVQPYGSIHVNYIQLDSVKGLPSGFTYATNPTNGNFPGGSNGCILLTGMPTVAEETGGPASNGKFPIVVYYHSNVTVPVVGTVNQPGTNKYYHITVLPMAAGIVENENDKFNVQPNSPNPADLRTDIHYWMPVTDDVEFRVYNVLGSLINSKMIHSDKGNNKYTLDTSTLTPGIYLYSVRSGNKTISRRMIVSAH
jgi:hypothetical protein